MWSRGRAFREAWMVLLSLEEPVKENARLRSKKAGRGPTREDLESQTQVCEPVFPAEMSH